ncbi:VOC family protein [Loktanella sp. Alg231-35]|uniref:VOC family protein n=1 Tax=Loktanella sp. Alg231-35 TaxID=1922220 RepID=UPI000D54B533|nr:VOC family protein [Loktanella sp. Alg231-35]
MITGIDHLQLALPAGKENAMRAFYCDVLGLQEVPKPHELQSRGGFWARAGTLAVHFGIDPDFHPATKAHPGFLDRDLTGLAAKLEQTGHMVTWDTTLPDVARLFTADPVGNRIELIAEG